MKLFSKTILFVILLTSSVSVLAQQSVTKALSSFAWEKRQILLFAPDTQDVQYQHFIADLAKQAGEFDDRNLQVWHLLTGQSVQLDNDVLQTKLAVTDFQIAYGVADDEFRVILIGYDQGEKLRQDSVDIERIFAEIDQMPMRIQEMRRKDTGAEQ